jgi:dolichyl-phosphate beta-glucosyltransferase
MNFNHTSEKQLFLSVIIPAYNEEKRIGNTLEKISHFLSTKSFLYEILVINDGSTDTTASVVTSCASQLPYVQLISLDKNKGKGFAVKIGIEQAQGDFILFTDADNSTPIEQLQKLLQAIKNSDISIGSRYLAESIIHVKQHPKRQFIAKVANTLNKLSPLKDIKDPRCGFKLFKCAVAKDIIKNQTIHRFGFDTELLLIAKARNYKVTEVPIEWHDHKDSKLRLRQHLVHTCFEMIYTQYLYHTGNYR